MLKYLFILPLLCCISFSFAQQQDGQYIHKHLVRSDASIVSGYMFNENIKNVYLNGNLEYYMDNKVSIRGDANYLLGSNGLSNDSAGLKDNSSVMLGAVFHMNSKGYFDSYFILQPGIAYTSSYLQNNSGEQMNRKYYPGVLSPLGSAGVGFNYYFQRFAHLFLETRYIYGQHVSRAPGPLSLQELRITFGLGFNLFIIKEKEQPVK
jgi:hypothetical protein